MRFKALESSLFVCMKMYTCVHNCASVCVCAPPCEREIERGTEVRVEFKEEYFMFEHSKKSWQMRKSEPTGFLVFFFFGILQNSLSNTHALSVFFYFSGGGVGCEGEKGGQKKK
uniref:Uncharacterized protein n=2 Tax=Rhizophora mucronata TaxID=61149 RepID=A0A2P2LME8_RHIMU